MTRLAVLSDIHGNAPALQAVLRQVRAEGADLLVNLGDIVSGAVDPRRTLEVLYATEMVTIGGNHERQLVGEPPERLGASDAFARDLMTDGDLTWLASLPDVVEPLPGVLAFHGSPSDNLCYLLETVTPRGLREASDEEVLERPGVQAGGYDVYLCGHTHLQRTRSLPDGSLVVNPGSVGMPAFSADAPYAHVVEAGSPHARYTLVDDASGRWRAEPRQVSYDHEATAVMAEANGRPDLAYTLRTGRAA
ncbi:MAG: metallophosphoesterase family protein [Dermatophilaceae bacterium]